MGNFPVVVFVVFLVLMIWHWLGCEIIHMLFLARAAGCQLFAAFLWAVINHGDRLMMLGTIAIQIGAIWWLCQYVKICFPDHFDW